MKKEDLLQEDINKQLEKARPIVVHKKEKGSGANTFNKFIMFCLCIAIIVGLIVTLIKVF